MKRTPTWAAKGIPTVVPGPKKSPSPPAGIANWLSRVTGVVLVQAAFVQMSVTLPEAACAEGTGNAATFVTKFAPGLLRLKRLKNSMNGDTLQSS